MPLKELIVVLAVYGVGMGILSTYQHVANYQRMQQDIRRANYSVTNPNRLYVSVAYRNEDAELSEVSQ